MLIVGDKEQQRGIKKSISLIMHIINNGIRIKICEKSQFSIVVVEYVYIASNMLLSLFRARALQIL